MPATAQSSNLTDKSTLTPFNVVTTVQGPSPSVLDCVEPQLLTRLKEAYSSDPKFADRGYLAHMTFHEGFWWSRGLLNSHQVVVPQGMSLSAIPVKGSRLTQLGARAYFSPFRSQICPGLPFHLNLLPAYPLQMKGTMRSSLWTG